MDWQKRQQERIEEMVAEIEYYISEGISKEVAIEMVTSETTIPQVAWVDRINSI